MKMLNISKNYLFFCFPDFHYFLKIINVQKDLRNNKSIESGLTLMRLQSEQLQEKDIMVVPFQSLPVTHIIHSFMQLYENQSMIQICMLACTLAIALCKQYHNPTQWCILHYFLCKSIYSPIRNFKLISSEWNMLSFQI